MVDFGYALSSEEHDPRSLVQQAQLAADAGFGSLWISDHFHPWLHEQGQSPFVWSVIGAIAATTPLAVTTAVTCPTMRIHPAIIAQAAATSAMLLDGRFELGVGSGENLNEHILGDTWPTTDTRLEMLEEALEVIRLLWTSEEVSHRGRHYTVENARIYSMPEVPPPIVMSGLRAEGHEVGCQDSPTASSPPSPTPRCCSCTATEEVWGPSSAALKVVWGPDREACIETGHRLWRSSGVPGELSQELRSPALFDQASTLVTKESVGESMPCGPDVEPIVDAVKAYVDAGFDRVFITQIGENQAEFFKFYVDELGPALAEIGVAPEREQPPLATATS